MQYRRAKRSKLSIEKKENILGTLMASGPFIGFLLFTLVPMLISFGISFTELHGFDLTQAKFVGFDNYVGLVTGEYYLLPYAIKNTLIWMISVPINMMVALFIANLLDKKLRGSKFLRTILFIPSICSTVAVTLMWSWILQTDYGIINTILMKMGLHKLGFTSDARLFMATCVMISVWIYGTNIVLMQNALRNVNPEIKEAAKIDGASDFYVFWKITVPMITPTLFYLLITNFVVASQEMQMMQILTENGLGPRYSAVTLSYYVYRMVWVSFTDDGFGVASALSWMMAIVVMVVTFLNFKLSKKWVHYE